MSACEFAHGFAEAPRAGADANHDLPQARIELIEARERTGAPGVDRNVRAHAGAQAGHVLIGVETEAQRDALHHFHPIAAGVLRRQDRELRARARSDRADASAPFPLRERIDRHRRGQAHLHIGQVELLRIAVHPEARVRDDGENRLTGRRDPAEFDLRDLRGDARDRRLHARVSEIALGILDLSLGLHVGGEGFDRDIGSAAELDPGCVLLLANEFQDLLGLDERGGRGVGFDARDRARGDQRLLAVIVGLPEIDGVLAHLDLVDIGDEGFAQIGEVDLGRRQTALGEGERRAIGRRIDVEQRIAGGDLLPLFHVNGNDRTGDVGRDQRLVGADIGVVGRDPTATREPPEEAERQRHEGDDDEQEKAATAAWTGGRRRRRSRRRRGGRFRRRLRNGRRGRRRRAGLRRPVAHTDRSLRHVSNPRRSIRS